MAQEDQHIAKYYLEKNTEAESKRMEEEAAAAHQREIDKVWKAMLAEDAEEKKRVI